MASSELIYNDGTVSVQNGSAVVVGDGTAATSFLLAGGHFSCQGYSVPIVSVEDDTHWTLAYPWPGETEDGAIYAVAMMTSQAADAVWLNAQVTKILTRITLSAVAPDGAGTLAERNALSPPPEDDYVWLRVETGQELELYVKIASGWAGPFPVRGPAGTGAPGSSAVRGTSSTLRGIAIGNRQFTVNEENRAWQPGTRLRFADAANPTANWMEGPVTAYDDGTNSVTIAADKIGGSGSFSSWVINITGEPGYSLTPKGPWASGATYALGDVVARSGSTYIALQAHTAASGNAPGTGASWQTCWMLAAAAGSGDVTGPAAATDGHVALFSGPSGKVLRSAGVAIQTSPLDGTLGRLMIVGAYGLGTNTAELITEAQMNSVNLPSGKYRIADPTGLPPGAYILEVSSYSSVAQYQKLSSTNSIGWSFERFVTDGGAQTWKPIYNTANLLGVVGFTSGLPNGGVIERGANANGDYVRFADGSQFCISAPFTGYTADTNVTGSFAAAFTPNTIAAFASYIPSTGWDTTISVYAAGTASWTFRSAQTKANNTVRIFAHGKWN